MTAQGGIALRSNVSLAERAWNIRRKALLMGEVQGQGYIGQALGIADVLATSYFHALEYRAEDPEWEGRDRFYLSIGHYAIALYAALMEAGILPEEELQTYGMDDSRMPMSGMASYTPGMEITGGSLGHGLGIAVRVGRAFLPRYRAVAPVGPVVSLPHIGVTVVRLDFRLQYCVDGLIGQRIHACGLARFMPQHCSGRCGGSRSGMCPARQVQHRDRRTERLFAEVEEAVIEAWPCVDDHAQIGAFLNLAYVTGESRLFNALGRTRRKHCRDVG